MLSRMKGCNLALFVLVFTSSGVGMAQIDKACYHPLGLADKTIPDSYLTATSSHAADTGPRYARLGRDEGGGAWCPLGLIEPGFEDQYLTIQLLQPSFVTRVATQGRYNHGNGKEFTKSFKLSYSRDGKNYFTWSSNAGVKVLQGNDVNVNKPKLRSLHPGIAGAKYIRIIPVTNIARAVCLRLELYGCTWRSGLVSYDIPTPDDHVALPPLAYSSSMFSDDTYDGKKTSSLFSGGLGQLSDGVKGDSDITKTKSRYPTAAVGYDFVGWTNPVGSKRKIMVDFQFAEPRNFTSITIYCAVNSAANARMFASLKISTSLDGISFVEVPGSSYPHWNAESDVRADVASLRAVDVVLPNVIARAITLTFDIGRSRLLLSEVEFQNTVLPPALLDRYTVNYSWVGREEDEETGVTQTPNHAEGGVNVGVVVGILVGIIVFLVVLVVALYWRQRTLRKTMVPPSCSYRSSRDDDMISQHPGSNGVATETKSAAPIYHEIGPTLPQDNLYLEPSDLSTGVPPPYRNTLDVADVAACDLVVQLPPLKTDVEKDTNGNTSHYAEANLFLPELKAQPIQGVSGNNIYAVPWTSPSPRRFGRKNKGKASTLPTLHGTSRETTDVLIEERNALLSSLNLTTRDLPPEFPRDRLEFIEKLGEGQFGEVHLCRADASIRDLDDGDGFNLPGPAHSSVLVAVKILRKGASSNAKEDFLKEVRIMGRLQDPNIVRLLAVCTKDEPFAMVTEYMEHGDLNQYLQTFDDDASPTPGQNVIKNESIIKMAAQIASGMEYLSSLKFVHRDLATRNCLVGTDFSIRIGDFGMSRNMYQSDYYRIQGRAVLPIRWMSWECVLMGKFSSASDVWSFGVTLWEMFSLCKYQPHSSMNDQQVIENMHHFYRKTNEQIYLPRPNRCPPSLFNMVRQCWKRAAEDRPPFHQLHTYLMERQQSEKLTSKSEKAQIKVPIPAVRTKVSD